MDPWWLEDYLIDRAIHEDHSKVKMMASNNTGRRLSELRRSGAAGKHGDRRLKRLRDRGAVKRAAIRESA